MRFLWCAPFMVGLLASGCNSVTAPGDGGVVYALHRIGDAVLPTPAWPGTAFPLVLGDTITIPTSRARPEGSLIVSRIEVFKEENGQVDSNSGRFNATRWADSLIVDTCPLGALCTAVGLVYNPLRLRVLGDSLFEMLPEGSPLKPRVYGRVSAR